MELTLTIAIGGIIFLGATRAVHTFVDAANENRNYLIALNLAKRQMAIMMNSAYPAVAAETLQAADATFPSYVPTQTVVSFATDGAYSIRQITIRIRVGTVTGPVLIRLDTYRSDAITFGTGS